MSVWGINLDLAMGFDWSNGLDAPVAVPVAAC
jgi:hypothetical protein